VGLSLFGDEMGEYTMKMAIVGSGALGLLWGARLIQKNVPTVLITRTQTQQQQLVKQGLILINHPRQETVQIPVEAIWIEADLERLSFDLLFVMVKQPQLASVMSKVQQISHMGSQIVFWQNGLGHEEQIAQLQYRPYTYAAVTTEGAWKKSAHCVVHTGGGETHIGSFPTYHQPLHSYLSELYSVYATSFSLRYDLAIQQRIWEKLTINSLINPLTAYYEISNGELLSDFYLQIMEALLDEIVAVAYQQGIGLHPEEMMLQVRQVCQNTAHNASSMLQDLRKGVQTEIDYINGAVVKWGKRTGIATPVHAEWVGRIHEKERMWGTR
jgi:2-dehydropantoate 2-reductase